jgi:hypothetical protein
MRHERRFLRTEDAPADHHDLCRHPQEVVMRWIPAALMLVLPAAPARGQCPDDAFEDNDSIGAAAPIAPGSYDLVLRSSQSPCGLDEDYFRVTVDDGMVLRVDLTFSHAAGNLNLWIYGSPADYPNGWLARSTSLTDDEAVSLPNHTGVPHEYWIWVQAASSFDSNDYAMDVSIAPDLCFGAPDDAYEPNDACASAAPVSAGLITGLHLGSADPDYYAVVLPDGQAIRADLYFTHDDLADVQLRLYDGCGAPLRSSFSATDDESATYANETGGPQTIVIDAFISTTSVGTCADYDLLVTLMPDPCPTTPDDGLEDNDDCFHAVEVEPGTHAGLAVFEGDEDAYKTLVPAGESVTVRLFFDHQRGNVDTHMFYVGGQCTQGLAAVSESDTDEETVELTNADPTDEEVYWEVYMSHLEQTSTLDCNVYTMVVEVTGRTGNPFCDASDGALDACPCANPGGPGSGCDVAQGTGGIALAVARQETAPQNRATLVGTGYPAASTPGVTVLRGSALDPASPVVFGDGLRCVGTPVVRVGAVLASGGTSTTTVGHGAAAGPGTFYYQLWVRNTPGMFCTPEAFNLSGGRTIVW